MQNRHRLSLQLAYTYSHEIDIQSGDLGSTNQQGSGGLLSNPFDTRYDRGSGVIDRRTYSTPTTSTISPRSRIGVRPCAYCWVAGRSPALP